MKKTLSRAQATFEPKGHGEKLSRKALGGYSDEVGSSWRELLLGKTPACLFPLFRVYFHRGSLSPMRYWPVDHPTVGATSSTLHPFN